MFATPKQYAFSLILKDPCVSHTMSETSVLPITISSHLFTDTKIQCELQIWMHRKNIAKYISYFWMSTLLKYLLKINTERTPFCAKRWDMNVVNTLFKICWRLFSTIHMINLKLSVHLFWVILFFRQAAAYFLPAHVSYQVLIFC